MKKVVVSRTKNEHAGATATVVQAARDSRPQIRDAADQFETARQLLDAQPPFAGLLCPLMNTAAVAIELYLKCLLAEKV
jgi:hypothetical protein